MLLLNATLLKVDCFCKSCCCFWGNKKWIFLFQVSLICVVVRVGCSSANCLFARILNSVAILKWNEWKIINYRSIFLIKLIEKGWSLSYSNWDYGFFLEEIKNRCRSEWTDGSITRSLAKIVEWIFRVKATAIEVKS